MRPVAQSASVSQSPSHAPSGEWLAGGVLPKFTKSRTTTAVSLFRSTLGPNLATAAARQHSVGEAWATRTATRMDK